VRVVIHFVDIGGIIGHHCLSFLFITVVLAFTILKNCVFLIIFFCPLLDILIFK